VLVLNDPANPGESDVILSESDRPERSGKANNVDAYRPVTARRQLPNKRTRPLLPTALLNKKNASNYFPTAFTKQRTRPITFQTALQQTKNASNYFQRVTKQKNASNTFQRRYQNKERGQLLSNGLPTKERVQLLSTAVTNKRKRGHYFPTAYQTKERVQLLSNGRCYGEPYSRLRVFIVPGRSEGPER